MVFLQDLAQTEYVNCVFSEFSVIFKAQVHLMEEKLPDKAHCDPWM